MSKPETEETRDNPTKDLQKIISDSRINQRVGVHRETKLLEDLVIYIVARDHRVLEHGIKLGKDQSNVG